MLLRHLDGALPIISRNAFIPQGGKLTCQNEMYRFGVVDNKDCIAALRLDAFGHRIPLLSLLIARFSITVENPSKINSRHFNPSFSSLLR